MHSSALKKVAFVHESKHVGGGQIFADRLFKILKEKSGFSSRLIDEPSPSTWWSILRGKYQVVVLNLFTPKWVFFLLLLKCFRIKYLVISYGVWKLDFAAQRPHMGVRSRLRWLQLIVGQTLLFWLADTIMVFSKYHQELTTQHFPWAAKKMRIIPGASEHRLTHLTSSTKRTNKQAVGIDPSKRMFLWMARMERRKGLDITVRAFAQAATKESILVIVFPMGLFNDYDYMFELLHLLDKLQLSGRVHICTGVAGDERFRFFRAADVFISASTTLETFGLTTLEAISHGCILAGFSQGAFKELVPNNMHKFVSDEVSTSRLARAIKTLATIDQHALNRLQKECIEMSKTNTWQKSGKLFIQEIEHLISTSS